MQDFNSNDEIRDKYIDATVAVFMEQYANALNTEINQEMIECEGNTFPPELDGRCRALIQQEYTKQRNAVRRKKFCGHAAVLQWWLLHCLAYVVFCL